MGFPISLWEILKNSSSLSISLEEDLGILGLYVKLEQMRMVGGFDYVVTIDDNIDLKEIKVPPLFMQPYVENAIWHGLRYKDEKGFLKIDIKENSKNSIEISIADNGIGRKKSAALKTNNQKKQKSKGMGNIKKRIDILNDMYKDKLAIFITDNDEDGTGTKVVFNLKKDQ